MSQINVDNVVPYSTNAVAVGNVSIKSLNNAVTLGKFNNLTTIGNFNVGVGVFALQYSTGGGNVGVGYGALRNVTSGAQNVAVGSESLRDATGSYNTAVGHGAAFQITTGQQNAFFGAGTGTSISTGNGNTFLGHGASGITTGNNNTVIGYLAQASSFTVSNEITLGGYSTTALRCAVTSITSLSDARDKKDVADLRAGLDFVKGLRPVEFVWDERDEEGRHDIADFGFIAQDLKAAQEDAELADVLKLVYESNPEKLEASYGKLVPILVKAVQELAAKVEQLESK
jgi:trimeric autotransporter adhesin